MKTVTDLLAFAKQFMGRKYVYGVLVPKDDPDYKFGFDCAEFIAYCNYQVFGILYGTDSHDPKNAHITNAYTGFFQKDATALGVIIPVTTAIKIPGAMLLRFPAPGADGHVVFSQGNGKTYEAASTKLGCLELGIAGRHFDIGVLLPGVTYDKANLDVVYTPPAIVYKLQTPLMHDDYIKQIQTALGFKGTAIDGVFGVATNKALVDFQRKKGLTVDGQIVPGGETSKALAI